MSFLSLRQLAKTYPDGTRAVLGIDLAVERGQFVVLLGPSGCGKTTTLRMIAGLELPTGGRIELDGADVTTLRPSQRDVGFVFQFYALYPHLRVKDNIAFPLVSAGLPSRQVERQVNAIAEQLGVTPLLGRYPRQLSGGDQQRVALARAVIRNPKLWLMDEPLGTLDADQRLVLREQIRRRQLESGVTSVYVTHDQEEAMSLADLLVVMDSGRIRQVGPPQELYDRPADLFVARFVGSPGMNFIEGTIDDRGVFATPGLALPFPAGAAPGPVTVGIRPEHVRIDPDGPLRATVEHDEYMGSHRFLHVRGEFGTMALRVDVHRPVSATSLRLSLDPKRLHLFDADGRRR